MTLNSDIFTAAKQLNEELGFLKKSPSGKYADSNTVHKFSNTVGRILKNNKSISLYAQKTTIETLAKQIENCRHNLSYYNRGPDQNGFKTNPDSDKEFESNIAVVITDDYHRIDATLNKAVEEILSSLENEKEIFSEIKAIHEKSHEKIKLAELEFKETIVRLNNSHKALLKTNEDQFNFSFEKVEKQRKQIEDLVPLIGGAGISSSFQKVANKEEERADSMRKITLCIFIISIALALISFGLFQTTDWHQSIFRLILSFIVASPAYYTAKESARHRTNADRARQVELELTSLPAYISDFGEEDQKKIKEKLIKSYFGKNINEHTIEGFVSQQDVFNSINNLLQNKTSEGKRSNPIKSIKSITNK